MTAKTNTSAPGFRSSEASPAAADKRPVAPAAIFIDFENLARMKPEAVVRQLRSYSRRMPVVVMRAYADWARFAKAKSLLAAAAVELTEMPANQMRKNSADMQLTVDAIELAVTHPQIETVILLSGDSDFVPLVRLLRKWGRQVWVASTDATASEQLKQVCDRFEWLEPSAPTAEPVAGDNHRPPHAAQRERTEDASAATKSPAAAQPNPQAPAVHLDEAIIALAAWGLHAAQQADALIARLADSPVQHQAQPVLMTRLLSAMRHLDPDFQLATYVTGKKRSNIRFIEALAAQGIVRIEKPTGRPHHVFAGDASGDLMRRYPRPERLDAAVAEMARYRGRPTARGAADLAKPGPQAPAEVKEDRCGTETDGSASATTQLHIFHDEELDQEAVALVRNADRTKPR